MTSEQRSGWILYYDGKCQFCRGIATLFWCLDLFALVKWIPHQSLESPPNGLVWNDLRQAAYLETQHGQIYGGFYAFRMLSLRLIPLFPLIPILWIPGLNILGTAIYNWIARHRHHFGICSEPAAGTMGRESQFCRQNLKPSNVTLTRRYRPITKLPGPRP